MSFDFIQCSKFMKMRIETSDHWQFESSFTISASMIEKVQSESTPSPPWEGRVKKLLYQRLFKKL